MNKSIGICLSGGGSRGFAHLGALQAMSELSIVPTKISGSSAGAIAAALYANGVPPQEALEKLSKVKLFWNLRPAFSKMGLFKLTQAEKVIKSMIPHDTFKQLHIPISVCALNIKRGEIKFFEEGNHLSKCIAASCAIPGIFKPVEIEGSHYIDGGVMNNLPVEPLTNSCDIIIGVNVTPFEKRMPVKSVKDIFLKSLYISIDKQTKAKEKYVDILIEPDKISRFDGLSLKRAHDLYQTGYQTTKKVLAEKLPELLE